MNRLFISERRSFGSRFLDEIVEWIGDNLEPDQIFTDEILIEWAVSLGFIKEDEEVE